MRHGAVAVELDLVQPVVAARAGPASAWRAAARCARASAALHRARQRAGLQLDRLGRRLRLLDQLLDAPAGFDAFRTRLEDVDRLARGEVALLEQQPVLLAPVLARLGLQPRQHPAAVQLLAGQPELEGAGRQALLDIVHRRPDAGVPDDHRPAAIFAFGDDALEVDIFERMVLGLDRQPLVGRVERGPFRHRPALQHVADLQPQIIVVGGRMVLVHDEAVAAVAANGNGRAAGSAVFEKSRLPR